MSVPLLLGNFTSKANEREQIRRYNEYLDLQIALSKSATEASERYVEAMKGRIIPSVVPVESSAELLSRTNQQKQMALKNLMTVMAGEEAVQTINNYFQDVNELTSLNQFFTDFKNRKLTGVAMITPELLNRRWDTYKVEQRLKGQTAVQTQTEEEEEEPEETKEEVIRPVSPMIENLVRSSISFEDFVDKYGGTNYRQGLLPLARAEKIREVGLSAEIIYNRLRKKYGLPHDPNKLTKKKK